MTDTSSFWDFSWADPSSWFSSAPTGGAETPAPSVDMSNASMADTVSSPGSGSGGLSSFDWSNFLNPGASSQGWSSSPGTGSSGGGTGAIDLSGILGGSSTRAPSAAANPTINTGGLTPTASPSSAISSAGFGGGGQSINVDPTASSGGSGSSPSVDQKDKAAGGSTGGILSALGLSVGDLFKAGLAGGGLIANLNSTPGPSAAQDALKSTAAAQNAQGTKLASYLENGTLPPGAQSWVDSQTAARKAQIKSQFANNGLSGSSMEMDALAQADQAATQQMFEIASSLLNTGISETSASGTLYNYLLQQQNADSKDVSSAIQNFIASLAGGGTGSGKDITLKVG